MKIAALVTASLLALSSPSIAWGHATLVRTEPENGVVLERPPTAVRVVFDDDVRAGPGIVAIRNGGGTILAGRPHVAGGRTLVIPLRPGLRRGSYSVRWAIVSDDGHLESGVLAFAVGAGSAPPTAALEPGSDEPQAGSVVSRWLFYAGLLGAVGIALFALVARPLDEERVAVVLSSSAVLTALGAAEEANRVGLDTRAGAAFGAAFVAAVVVASLGGAATLERRALRPALVLALGLAAAPAFAGHALDRGLNRANVVADALHVTGAAAWVGALLGLVVLREASRRRAVWLAAAGVVVLGATGIFRASFELVRAAQLWDTSYGKALLVKTALLLAALAAGFLLRTRIRVRAGTELLFAAGIVIAASILVLLEPGRNLEEAVARRVEAAEPAPPPPAPEPGAVVTAAQLGPLGAALEVERERARVIVLSPAGGGLSGLDVRVDGIPAAPCGSGCYQVQSALSGSVEVEIADFGPTLRHTFDLPRSAPAATQLLRRAEDRYRALDSVFFLQHLASSPSHAVTTLWRLERPDRVSYSVRGGAQGIVIGGKRWDRADAEARWQRSAQTPLPQPALPWSSATNAHLIGDTGETKTVAFVDPTTPAYFELTLDSKTLLPRELHMTASAHFMTERYVRFNDEREIFPPR